MTVYKLAVIGTAGRKEDRYVLKKGHYDRMVEATIKLIDHLKIPREELLLYSGGAAWADHVVVSLAVMGIVPHKNVTLYLPCEVTDNGFVGNSESAKKTADTANYYHSMFTKHLERDTFQEILDIDNKGATLVPGNGNFFARNALVSKAVCPDGMLLAFTLGSPDSPQPSWTIKSFDPVTKAVDAGLKDGGTAHTWNLSNCKKYHGRIGHVA